MDQPADPADGEQADELKETAASVPAEASPTSPTDTPMALQILGAAEKAGPHEAEDKQARLRAADWENTIPSPLFLMILPSKDSGHYLFIVREKYRQLAEEVLAQLAAFLIYYLELHKVESRVQRDILCGWLDVSHVDYTARHAIVWDPKIAAAMSEYDKNKQLEVQIQQDDEWLDTFDESPVVTSFKGVVSLDLDLPSVRDIDDGATVASVLNEIRQLRAMATDMQEMMAQTEAMEVEMEEHKAARAAIQQELDTSTKEAAQRTAEITEKDAEIRALRKQLERQNLASQPSQNSSQPMELHNDSSAPADKGGGSSSKSS
mmetsp:Transcript_7924/g.19130  ORF Transcript_7924/g.19130 Transcript_7924/m.19130 type:complete len:320 (+) Transcript_7924:2406-3365(+)